MKKTLSCFLFFIFILLLSTVSHADLDIFLSSLNVQAKADLGGFNVKLSAQFNVPLPEVDAVVKAVDTSADAFMCFQLSKMTAKSPDVVVQVYKTNKGKGWGAIAKELGIKPGSPEFHALKNGDFELSGGESQGCGNNNGHGRGKGKSKRK
jgi:hypothetical protein